MTSESHAVLCVSLRFYVFVDDVSESLTYSPYPKSSTKNIMIFGRFLVVVDMTDVIVNMTRNTRHIIFLL